MFAKLSVSFLVLIFASQCLAQRCPFERFYKTISQNSSASELEKVKAENDLARCLIASVLPKGNEGPIPAQLPATLSGLIGKPIDVDILKLQKYLNDNSISDAMIGGKVEQNVTKARFFVFHDTSFPTVNAPNFPSDINEETWSGNELSNWVATDTPTHVFVNRIGRSKMKANFSETVLAMKYDLGKDKPKGSVARSTARAFRGGFFIHIELIQPRRRSRPNSKYYDIPPTPGFTQSQLDRMALLYVVASVRSKRWLLPGFHFSIDTPIPDAHDDPQNIDFNAWLNSLGSLLVKLRE